MHVFYILNHKIELIDVSNSNMTYDASKDNKSDNRKDSDDKNGNRKGVHK